MSGGDTQQSPPPPPPPRSGSPFGRFLTSPVLVVGVIALVAGAAALNFVPGDGGGPGDASGQESGIDGSWESPAGDVGGQPVVHLDVSRFGGTLTRGRCTGRLSPRETESDDEWVFTYTHESGGRRCPRRMRVTVSLVDEGTLRIEARRRGREYLSGTLTRDG